MTKMHTWTFLALYIFAQLGIGQGSNVRREDSDSNSYESEDRESSRGGGLTRREQARGMHRFTKRFQRAYCRDSAGDYGSCRQCVAVGCLRYMKGPRDTGGYDRCLADHNRCCTRPGISKKNAELGAKCYATGAVTEIIGGQLSVVRTILGEQVSDAPRGFKGTTRVDD